MNARRRLKALSLPLWMVAGQVSPAASTRILRLGAQTSRPRGILNRASLAGLLLLGAMLLPSAPALAQTQPIVSNLGEDSRISAGHPGSEVANAFTTGRNVNGYILTNVVFATPSNASSVTVSIYSDASGPPGITLATLTGPSTIPAAGHHTYTASRGITLSSSTTYHVGITRAFINATISARQISSDNWDISHYIHSRALEGATLTWSQSGSNSALLFSISALRKPSEAVRMRLRVFLEGPLE